MLADMRRAVYPGSFDPPTYGHLDIIDRASQLYDELIVAVGVNSDKQPFLPADERARLLTECVADIPHVKVTQFEGLLVDYARKQQCQVIVRGLRAVSDYEYEFRVAMANRRMAPEVETVFMISRDEYSFLASSVVREVSRLGGDTKLFVPDNVADSIARFKAMP